MSDSQTWVLRVCRPSNDPVGVAFLVDRMTAVTCAHVINQACGRSINEETVPKAGVVLLDSPFMAQPWSMQAKVRPEGWTPIDQWGEGDIAVLDLVDSPPPTAKSATLKHFRSLWGHPYRAYGFPTGNDRGAWTRGEFLGPVGRDWIQVESLTTTGTAIEQGFSGSPVWDDKTKSVVGMIVAADRDPMAKTAFMIPTEVLMRALASEKRGKAAQLGALIRSAVDTRSREGARAVLKSAATDIGTWSTRSPKFSRSYRAEGLDISSLVQGLEEWCKSQAMETQSFAHQSTQLIQARNPARPGLDSIPKPQAPTIRMELVGDAWRLDVGTMPWVSLDMMKSPMLVIAGVLGAVLKPQGIGSRLLTLNSLREWITFAQRALEVADYIAHREDGGAS